MPISKAQKAIHKKIEHAMAKKVGKTAPDGLNPLRSNKMTIWMQKNTAQANNKYTANFDEKKQLLEMEELFTKFDMDGGGTLDLDELVHMFQQAGLRVSSNKLKDMFYLPKNVEIINNEVNLEQFQKLMLSPELQKAFRELLTEIRRRFKYHDFSMIDPEVGYLPSDLSLMLGYLYKRSVRENLQDQITSHKLESTQEMTTKELFERVIHDFDRFTDIFHLHDDGNFDQELRQRYRVGPQERKFRSDQNPERRKELLQLRGITTFFLNRVKELATSHQNMKGIVDEQVLKHKIPSLSKDRQMKMTASHEQIEVSMKNLHEIQNQRREIEEHKAKQVDEFFDIQRALTITKSNSKLFDPQVTFDRTDTYQTVGAADVSMIKDKEERGLFELLNSLNENLEVLDGVKEVFELADTNDDTNLKHPSPVRKVPEQKEDETLKIIEGIPTPKRVTKGKAVFIVPDKSKHMNQEQKAAQRNAAIARLMMEQTQTNDSSEYNDVQTESQQGTPEQKKKRHLNSQTHKNLPPVHRNSSSMMHRSKLSNEANSPLFNIQMDGNEISSLGRSVMNKKSTFNNPFKQQLEVGSKELMAEMLGQSRDNNLTDFQKLSLQQTKNTSKQSKIIVFGDCVNQFEKMVDSQSHLLQSQPSFQKAQLDRNFSIQSTSKDENTEEQLSQEDSIMYESRPEAKSALEIGHLKIAVNQSAEMINVQESNSKVQETPVKKADSIFSLSIYDPSHQLSRDQVVNNVPRKRDPKHHHSQQRQQSQSILQPAKVIGDQNREQIQQNNLLLMSQKMKMFASPIAPQRGRTLQKQLASSATGPALEHFKILNSKNSSEVFTQASDPRKQAPMQTSSHQTLPAIQRNAQPAPLVQRQNRDVIFSSDRSDKTLSYKGPQNLRSQMDKEGSIVLLNEPAIDHYMSVPKFHRNYATSKIRSNNESTKLIMPQHYNMHRQPTKNYSISHQYSQSEIDYNYGGYVPKTQNKSGADASFFNSKQLNEQAASSAAMLLKQASLIKKAVQKRKKRHSPDRAHSEMQTLTQVHKNKRNILNSQKTAPDQTKVRQSQQNEIQTPLDKESEKNPPYESGQYTYSSDIQKRFSKLSSKRQKKSPLANSASPRISDISSNNTSVAKIDLGAQNSFAQVKQKQPQVVHEVSAHMLLSQQQMQSLGVSSLGRQSISSLSKGATVGLPSLAAAQARPMVRKPAINASQEKPVANADNQSGIVGVFGDALQSSGVEKSTTGKKEKLFKLKHKKKNRKESQVSDGPTSRQRILSTEQSQTPRLEPNYDAKVDLKVDEQISAQKSLIDLSNSYAFDVKTQNQETINSASTGNVGVQPGMLKQRPIYSGELESRQDLPQSSNNVLTSVQYTNEYGYLPNLQYGNVINSPNDNDVHSELRVQSRGIPNKFDDSLTPGMTQSSFKTQQANQNNGTAIQNPEIKIFQGKRNANFIVTDQYGASKKPPTKKTSPFQKFQARMQRLEVNSRDEPSPQYVVQESLQTPMFKADGQKRHDSQALGTAITGTHSGTGQTAHPLSFGKHTRQSWNQHIKVIGNQSQASTGQPQQGIKNQQRSTNGSNKLRESQSHWGTAESGFYRHLKSDKRSQQQHTNVNGTIKKKKMSQTITQANDLRNASQDQSQILEHSQMLSVVKMNVMNGIQVQGRQSGIQNVDITQDFATHQSLGQTEHLDRTIQSHIRSQEKDLSQELNQDLPATNYIEDSLSQSNNLDQNINNRSTKLLGNDQLSMQGTESLTNGAGSGFKIHSSFAAANPLVPSSLDISSSNQTPIMEHSERLQPIAELAQLGHNRRNVENKTTDNVKDK